MANKGAAFKKEKKSCFAAHTHKTERPLHPTTETSSGTKTDDVVNLKRTDKKKVND